MAVKGIRLKKGEVRNLIAIPENYGKRVTVGGITTRVEPRIEVSVWKDKWGRYTVTEKGHRLTAQEKRLGLKRTRSGEAQVIKQTFESLGPKATMRKMGGKETRRLKSWKVGPTEGWIDIRKKEFIGKERVGRQGEMERLMRSLDGTTAAINNRISFLDAWNDLTQKQRLRLMEMLQDVDWEAFFKEFVDSDGKFDEFIDETRQMEGLEQVMDMFRKVGF